jgi:hypothetical protein
MKPDGIHFEKGMIPGLPFQIYLDLGLGLAEPIINPKIKGSQRVDYYKNNYCARCEIKYPKTRKNCECGQKLRTKPWHGRSNFANGGRY